MTMCDKEGYVPVVTVEDADDLEHHASHSPSRRNDLWQRWRARLTPLVVLLQSIAIIVLLLRHPTPRLHPAPGSTHFLYSPAEEALEDELINFRAGTEHKSPYQALSDEADQLWSDLYIPPSVFMMPREHAVRLPNRTYPVPKYADEGLYLGQLDVFHQLHCLNYLRMSLSPERYKPVIREDLLEFEHLNHCVDSIRQSLMCASDISVNVWQWSEHYQGLVGRVNVAHSCRNFDKLREWARERHRSQ
ncbi:hypothetical protein EV121DRAFT_295148 [Schizophyllum commune]